MKKMSELEKQAARDYLSAAAKIPEDLRSAALEKANTYLSGMADMAAMVSPARKEEQPHEE